MQIRGGRISCLVYFALGLAEAALQRSKDLYQVNKALITTGRMAEVEIFQTEAEVANREVALKEADNQIDASRLALLNLLALEPRTPVIAVEAKDIPTCLMMKLVGLSGLGIYALRVKNSLSTPVASCRYTAGFRLR